MLTNCQYAGPAKSVRGITLCPCGLMSVGTGQNVMVNASVCATCSGGVSAGGLPYTAITANLLWRVGAGKLTQAHAEALATAAGIPLD